MAIKRRFELVDGTSSKFWEIAVDDATVSVCFGRIGTAGSAKDKAHASPAEAQREVDKLVAEKTKKGYVEVGASASPAPAAPKSAAPAPAAKKSAAPAPAAPKPAALEAASPALTPECATTATAAHPAIDAMLAAIAKKEKSLAKQLRPGAGEGELQSLRALGVPDAMIALHARHDGSEAELFGSYQLLSIAGIESERATMNGILAEKPEWKAASRWKTEWVPFLSDGDGQLFCFDPVGGTDGGPPGQIVAYDHETGPARELASFDVLVELVTTLAKRGLLTQEAQEEAGEAFEDVYAKARNIGVAKMPPKDLKKVRKRLNEEELTNEQKLEVALPLAREFSAESALWQEVSYAARYLGKWELMAKAATRVVQLTPARDRPFMEAELVLALHRCGREKEALAAMAAALKLKTNYPEKLIPEDAEPDFVHRCYVMATEARPRDYQLWLGRGRHAKDLAERAAAFHTVAELTSDKDLIRYNEGIAMSVAEQARYLLELDRIFALEGKARLDALVALAMPRKEAATWLLAVECATALEDWQTADLAAEHAVELHGAEYQRYEWAHHRIRALHELGRDDQAVEVLGTVLEAMWDKEGPAALEAIPWREARAAGASDRSPKQEAFEETCFVAATKVQPENAYLWSGLARAASKPADQKAALEKVVAICSDPKRVFVHDPTRGRSFNERDERIYAGLCALREQAEAQLRRA